jgi:hypothetical protein
VSHIEADELALLWAEVAEPEEERLVETLARRASWRGRLLQYADLGGAIALAGGVAVVVLKEGGELTAVSGLLLILALAWQTWKRSTLWDVELSAAGNRELFLADAEKAAAARLKRTELSILLLLPVSLAAMWFALALFGGADSFAGALGEAMARSRQTAIFIGIVAALFAHLFIARGRLRAELRRIAELARLYGEAARLDRLP